MEPENHLFRNEHHLPSSMSLFVPGVVFLNDWTHSQQILQSSQTSSSSGSTPWGGRGKLLGRPPDGFERLEPPNWKFGRWISVSNGMSFPSGLIYVRNFGGVFHWMAGKLGFRLFTQLVCKLVIISVIIRKFIYSIQNWNRLRFFATDISGGTGKLEIESVCAGNDLRYKLTAL